MLKLPIQITKEEDVTPGLLRELAVLYARKMVKQDGEYLEANITFQGEIWLKVHDGKIAKGSKASIDFTRERLMVNVGE